MYVQFTHTLPDALVPLATNTINGFSNPNLYGWLDTADAKKMRHRAMYLICDLETIEDVDVYSNPSLMVASNENEAVTMYNIITGIMHGTVICEVHHDCSKVTVVPTGRTMESDRPKVAFPV